ncbi:MAG: DNA internalization-related competence protein ComEC/Rec2, partial [Deltaproteobacteria bacterium]|nr:DNA internalization-related competence protein ComEC/Rec2 [Deltaproteobacteria bacterium]
RSNTDPFVMDLATRREKVTLEATVLQELSSSGDGARYAIRIYKIKVGRGKKATERRTDAKCRFTIYRNAPTLHPGDRIHSPARLGLFKNFNNPGGFDYASYMRWKGFECSASVSEGRMVVPMGVAQLGFPRGWIEGARKDAKEFLWENLPSENAGILAALILGERQRISSSFRDRLNRSGLGHMLAVSGLHIGLVALLAFSLFKTLLSFSYRVSLKIDIRKVSALGSMLTVIMYTALSGFQVSSQRAMIMALAYFASMIMGRERDLWSTLCIAALLILSLDPGAISSISFQLSFMAVAGILLLGPRLVQRMPLPFHWTGGEKSSLLRRLYSYIIGIVAVTISAVFFLLPLSAYYFHQVSLVSVPANMTVLPILGLWVLPLGLLAVFLLPFSHFISRCLLGASSWGVEGMKVMAGFWADLPWSSFWTPIPSILEIGLFYGFVLFLFAPGRRRWKRPAIYLILLLALGDISYWFYMTWFHRSLQVTFLDVGQGNAAVIRFPGRKRMLVDGGGFTRDTFDVGRMVVAPYLLRSKIGRMDYLVLSHPHPDHLNGLRFIARHFAPSEFWYNGQRSKQESFKDLMSIIESENIEMRLPRDLAVSRSISGVRIDVLHPPPVGEGQFPYGKKMRANDLSMVLKISYRGISFLFPGDIEKAGEQSVVKKAGPRLRSDVLLVPHHGGRTSCSRSFLDMVKPSICVVSGGRGNPYGFPHPETMERLKEAGCRILRIDQMGSIDISVGEGGFKVSSFLAGTLMKGKEFSGLKDRPERQGRGKDQGKSSSPLP